jgi:hypothetical protein
MFKKLDIKNVFAHPPVLLGHDDHGMIADNQVIVFGIGLGK